MIHLDEARGAAGPGGPTLYEFWADLGRRSLKVTERRLLETAERRYQRLTGLRSTEVCCVQWPAAKSGKRMHIFVCFAPNLMRLGPALLRLCADSVVVTEGWQQEPGNPVEDIVKVLDLPEQTRGQVELADAQSADIQKMLVYPEGAATELTDESEKPVPGEAREVILDSGATDSPKGEMGRMARIVELPSGMKLDLWQREIAETEAELSKLVLGQCIPADDTKPDPEPDR